MIYPLRVVLANSNLKIKAMNSISKTIVLKLFLLLSLLILYISTIAQKIIQGLFYYDHSPVSIEINEGKISQITRLEDVPADFPKLYIAPGFIDNQVNGFAGVTFALGSGKLTLDGVKKATKVLWKYGVTTYLPTLTTNSHELLLNNLNILATAKNDPDLHGSIAGFHMEGPYINPEDGYRGAHPKEHVRLPDWDEFMEYYKASGKNILQITVAPEMEGALDFITKCRNKNINVALGHHNAPAEVVFAAIDRGANIATHLGNGVANMINRHRNPFWSQLADDRFNISIICDGFHLRPEEINVFYKVKGVEKTIITSDVTSYGSLPPGNYFTAEGDSIRITEEGMLWNVVQGGLYGSASPLIKGVGHIIKVTGCSLADAVQMASTNPARLYGLNDRGTLQPGMRADLVIFSLEDFKIQIKETWIEGELVYENN
jgi:N-acetylglucosamine-6-phosphate deacetylase